MSTVKALIVDLDDLRVAEITPSLRELQAAVGGYIEPVSSPQGGWTAYVDEEGKVKGKPRNRAATALARALGWDGMPGDYLAGPVIFLGYDDDTDEYGDVPDLVLNAWGFVST